MRPIQTLFLTSLLAIAAALGPSFAQTAGAETPATEAVLANQAETGDEPAAESGAKAEAEAPGALLPQTAAELIELSIDRRSAAPVSAGETELSSFLWQNRVLVIFADTDRDLNYLRQMDLITARLLPLEERGVVVLTDTDPSGKSSIRTKLRPRGFAAVLVDKDGRIISRRPSPWDVREIERTIDSTPLRLQELREKRDAIDPLRSGNR